MLKSLLIANRGEIACRIIRTARSLGIRTVAVYSDADARALHVRQADEAVHIGPSPARESYLVGEKIIAAAKATGAEAIHPGYGFLSENAEFAEAVIAAGLIWVGPKPDSIRAMGLKDAAKKLMDAAGVPTTPGYLGEDQSPERLAAEAERIGYPVLIKAVAGGGGKGMRKVDDASGFADALISCKREAAASFGNDVVLLEKWIESPRHIEVQVFGDAHGNVVHLFERDCSLQRRHQKVIEEAPAPGMDAATREAVCGAAVRAAKAVDYQGAGTIEFIADGSQGLRADRIWFMEMNTRLQVEHPVTEEITGVDLVEWQLRVASGEPIPLKQEELSINGWAMEARLYAEDPAKGFLPSIGRLEHCRLPDEARIETGVFEGAEVSPFYDPMIAKIVVHGGDRDEAIELLREASEQVEVAPVRTNAAFLAACLRSDLFCSGDVTTGFIDQNIDSLVAPKRSNTALAAALSWRLEQFMEIDAARFDASAANPSALFGFRLNASRVAARLDFTRDGEAQFALAEVKGRGADWRWQVAVDGRDIFERLDDLPTTYGADPVEPFEGPIRVFDGGASETFEFGGRVRGGSGHAVGDGSILSPMPGKVIAVDVAAGQAVTKGQKLLTLEAMKMEHSLVAPFDGVVAELNVSEGAQVQVEALLVRVEAAEA
ncbi:MAG: methylcrotonoyl-CoA carboxylase [Sphingomonadales bacterium RIFCSPHIGHO2_01_FULL_65_20]|uniref:acetyl-CoA carboxylase biotin carboxylase subunit n=1 Tax=unclassified Blastomonas TaxID=2626550 RepID=UPI00082C2551|nr:acetyl/propionyl/methylcrotonyl-CoA carboxylase subunit alpha [Blastomonas sp.]MCH2238286.1 acetyl/propionyl/methylcrotonyl-CoA carboxylase subunit alpha [Blastomonas sp.]OHC97902.1 MAG: methylcrotonoyl-CoA carboxylase [Sphingomonadales bacterium RIFCSPHIGHO2_01_FULL_65_20]